MASLGLASAYGRSCCQHLTLTLTFSQTNELTQMKLRPSHGVGRAGFLEVATLALSHHAFLFRLSLIGTWMGTSTDARWTASYPFSKQGMAPDKRPLQLSRSTDDRTLRAFINLLPDLPVPDVSLARQAVRVRHVALRLATQPCCKGGVSWQCSGMMALGFGRYTGGRAISCTSFAAAAGIQPRA